jgi:hypothetical protein
MANNIQNKLQIVGVKDEAKKVFDFISSKDEDGKPIQIDFNKIKPMPAGMEANPHSGIEIWLKICTGKCDFNSLFENSAQKKTYGEVWTEDKENGFDNMLNYMETSRAMKVLLHEGGRKTVEEFNDEEFEIFIQCLKNHRQHKFFSWYKWSLENWGTKWNAYAQNDKRNTGDTIYFETANNAPIELMKELSKKFPNVTIFLSYADEDSGSNTGKFEMKNGEVLWFNQPESQSKEGYEFYFELHPDRKGDYKLVEDKYEYVDEE